MILVTGGMGYIGSHTVVELLNSNYEVVVVDNLSNSSILVKDRIKKITNKDFKFYNVDVTDKESLKKVFEENKIDSIIHFAAFKAVGESVEKPLEYYENNLVTSPLSDAISKDLQKRGMKFVGTTIIYSYLQAIGVIYSHEMECYLKIKK